MRTLARCLFVILATPALGAKGENPKLVAARNAMLAQAVPASCPELDLDGEALEAFMARAGLAEHDMTGTYRTVTAAAVEAFRRAVAADPAQACADIDGRLGANGPGLLLRRDSR